MQSSAAVFVARGKPGGLLVLSLWDTCSLIPPFLTIDDVIELESKSRVSPPSAISSTNFAKGSADVASKEKNQLKRTYRLGMGNKGEGRSIAPTEEDLQTEACRLLQIIGGAGHGGQRALGKLSDLFCVFVMQFLMHDLRLTKAEAEEAYCDAMRVVWDKAKTFDPNSGATVRTWLCGIARNKALHIRRDRAPDSQGSAARASLEEIAQHSESGTEGISTSGTVCFPDETLDVREVLEKCMEALSPEQRSVLSLLHEPISYENLADSLGIAVGTVKSRFNSAINSLTLCCKRHGVSWSTEA